MASRSTLLVAAALTASLAATSVARAQPSAADRETARSLMQEGRDLRDKGNVKEALRRFQGADAIMHVPTTGLEVARTQVSLGLLVEARDTIASIRKTTPKPNEPEQFKEARTNADKLDVALEGRVPAITIVVKGAPEGEKAAVTVDEVEVPAEVVGLPRRVDPGHHVIAAKTEHGEGHQEIDINEGQQKDVEVTLVITAPPPGSETPSTPAQAEETPPPATTSHGPTILTWAGVALAGAGVITGTVTGVVSLSKKSQLESQCLDHVCGPSSYGTYNAANTFATISTIGFVAAGAGAGVAVVSLLVGHSTQPAPAAQPPAEGLRVTPWIGLGGAGLSGAF
jgi:hypothetical protein